MNDFQQATARDRERSIESSEDAATILLATLLVAAGLVFWFA